MKCNFRLVFLISRTKTSDPKNDLSQPREKKSSTTDSTSHRKTDDSNKSSNKSSNPYKSDRIVTSNSRTYEANERQTTVVYSLGKLLNFRTSLSHLLDHLMMMLWNVLLMN